MELLEEVIPNKLFLSINNNTLQTQLSQYHLPLLIHNKKITQLGSFKFLTIFNDLCLEEVECVLIITKHSLNPSLWNTCKKKCYENHVGLEWLNFNKGLTILNELTYQKRSFYAFIQLEL